MRDLGLVVEVRSDVVSVDVLSVVPVAVRRDVGDFLAVAGINQNVDCGHAHGERRLSNSTEQCAVADSSLDDGACIEAGSQDGVSRIGAENFEVVIGSQEAFCCNLVGAEDTDEVFLVHDSSSFSCAELCGGLSRNTDFNDDVGICFSNLVDLAVIDILLIADNSNFEAVSSSEFAELVNEAKATADDGFTGSILVDFTDTDRSTRSGDLVFQRGWFLRERWEHRSQMRQRGYLHLLQPAGIPEWCQGRWLQCQCRQERC